MGQLVNDHYVLEDLKRCCEKACEMEEQRYQSLVGFSARLLTSISILTLAMVTIAGIEHDGRSLLLVGLRWPVVVAALALAVSFLLSLISQFRFKVLMAASPLKNIEKDFMVKDFEYAAQSTNYYIATLSDYHESMEARNDVMKRLLNWSLLCAIVAVAAFVIWIISLFI